MNVTISGAEDSPSAPLMVDSVFTLNVAAPHRAAHKQQPGADGYRRPRSDERPLKPERERDGLAPSAPPETAAERKHPQQGHAPKRGSLRVQRNERYR